MKLSFKAQLKDAKERIVEGYATTDSWDKQGEKLPMEVAKKAFERFVKSPKICRLHGREEFGAVNPCGCGGVGELTGYTADDKGIMIAVKITDGVAWDKVVKGEYNGFSIGGYSRANDGVITDFELVEISLVGVPANGDCVFLTAKGEIKMDEESKELLKLIVENQKLMLAELVKYNAPIPVNPAHTFQWVFCDYSTSLPSNTAQAYYAHQHRQCAANRAKRSPRRLFLEFQAVAQPLRK